MTSRTVVGLVLVGLLGCADAGGSSPNQSIDERCPFAHAPGVDFALRREDGTDACTYGCQRVVDDAGAHGVLWCGNACVNVDTATNCGSCGRRCMGRTPYCNADHDCVAPTP